MKSKLSTTKGSGKLSPSLDPDLAKWCAVLAESAAPVDAVPPGWFICRDLAKKTNAAVGTLQTKLKRLVTQGKAERRKFRIVCGKVTRPVPHYRLR